MGSGMAGRSAARLGTHAGGRVGMAPRSRILIRRLVMLLLDGRVRPRLRTDRGRIRVLRLVGLVTRGWLIVLLLPGRVAAGLGRSGRDAARRRQRRYRLGVRGDREASQ